MNLSQRFHRYVYCEEQIKPLNIDIGDSNTILINNSSFYKQYDANILQGIQQKFQMRAEKQEDDFQRRVYVRQYHCHCSPCRLYDWDNCANKHLPAAQWIQHDIAIAAKEKNKANIDVVEFYSKQRRGKWNSKGLMVIAFEFNDLKRLILAELLLPPFKNNDRTGMKVIRLSDSEIIRVKVHRDEYVVNVRLLVKKVGCSKSSTYEFQNETEQITVPVSYIYLDIEELNHTYNITNENYIDVQYDTSAKTSTIVVINYRKWVELL